MGVSFIDYSLLAGIVFCFAWIGNMYEVQKDLVSRLSVLTGIVLGQMTPDAVSNLKAYNIEISQREPIKKRGF